MISLVHTESEKMIRSDKWYSGFYPAEFSITDRPLKVWQLLMARKESWARCSSLRKGLFASRLYYSPLPCQVWEGRHLLHYRYWAVMGGRHWKIGGIVVRKKRKGVALYLPPTNLELSFSLPSTANPDRGLGLYPPSIKGDPHERAESNRAPTVRMSSLKFDFIGLRYNTIQLRKG